MKDLESGVMVYDSPAHTQSREWDMSRARPWKDPATPSQMAAVLVRVSIAVKRHDDHGNSYKEYI